MTSSKETAVELSVVNEAETVDLTIQETGENEMQTQETVDLSVGETENAKTVSVETDAKPYVDPTAYLASYAARRSELRELFADVNEKAARLVENIPTLEYQTVFSGMLPDGLSGDLEKDIEREFPQRWIEKAERDHAKGDPVAFAELQAKEFMAGAHNSTLRNLLSVMSQKLDDLLCDVELPSDVIVKRVVDFKDGFVVRIEKPSRGGSSGATRVTGGSWVIPGLHVSPSTPSGYRVIVGATLRSWQVWTIDDPDGKFDLEYVATHGLPKTAVAHGICDQGAGKSLNASVNGAIRTVTKSKTAYSLPTKIFPDCNVYLSSLGVKEYSELRELSILRKSRKLTQGEMDQLWDLLPQSGANYSQTLVDVDTLQPSIKTVETAQE